MRRLLAAVLAAALMIPAAGCAARPAEPESGPSMRAGNICGDERG